MDSDGDGYSVEGGDCDDEDDDVYPGARDACANDVDDDCDGAVDDGCGPFFPLGSNAVLYTGEAEEDYAGTSVGGAGDVNQDGYDDMLVGAPFSWDAAPVAGTAYLVLGSGSPVSGSLSDAIAYTGEATYDFAGTSVAGAGDVDGDGYDDFVIGAPSNDAGGAYAGAAFLVRGSAIPVPSGLAAAMRLTGQPGDEAGESVASAGDVNADGFSDLVIGAWENNDGTWSAGAAYLVLGGSTSSVTADLSDAIEYSGSSLSEFAGRSVTGAGDVDGDGHDDVLVGAFGNADAADGAGAAFLILGADVPVGGSLRREAVEYTGEGGSDGAGRSVAGAGDVNGDGHSDIVVGASDNSDAGLYAGAAYIVLGSAEPSSVSLAEAAEYTGGAPLDHAGRVSGGGDIDADGYDDVLVNTPGSDDGGRESGAVYVIFGGTAPAGSALANLLTYGGEADENVGAVACAGDTDADGLMDLLIGAEEREPSNTGAAYLVSGSSAASAAGRER